MKMVATLCMGGEKKFRLEKKKIFKNQIEQIYSAFHEKCCKRFTKGLRPGIPTTVSFSTPWGA